ncbi:MAG TPA: rhodanese-like domain-containing protein [Gemmatimonadaceae bacterium]|jgi:adenylyltransferase/sulfurtransferase
MSDNNFDARAIAANPSVRELPARIALEMLQRGDDVVYLDVRELHEWNLFRIPGAVHIPLGTLREQAPGRIAAGRRVMVYCARGGRAATAAQTLADLGYSDVVSLEGGLSAWVSVGGVLEE